MAGSRVGGRGRGVWRPGRRLGRGTRGASALRREAACEERLQGGNGGIAAARRDARARTMTSGADAWLVDDRWGKAYPLTDQETTIGRGQPSAIIIRDPAVSRVHASVRRRGVEFVLSVTGSAGTSVNGEPV